MTINEVLKSLTPENARFVPGQDLFMYLPKAQTSQRYGLVKYSSADFSISGGGVLTLLLPASQIQQYLTEIRGGTREETVIADPAINLVTLNEADELLSSHITTLYSRDGEIYGALGREGTVIAVDKIDLSTLRAADVQLQANIDALIDDTKPESALDTTYSSNKITALIRQAKLEGLHFVGFIGETVGVNHDGDPIIKEGALWHVSDEVTTPVIENKWLSATMYKCVNGEWVQSVDYTPLDFDIWKNVNLDDAQINSWWWFETAFEVLDFNVDMSNYFTKDESDARFKAIFSYGDYLSETNHVLNISNLTMPTTGALSSFVKGESGLDVTNVESAIKLLESNTNSSLLSLFNRATILSLSDTPTRAGDIASSTDGVYISVAGVEPDTYEWTLLTIDLSTLLPKSNADTNVAYGLSFSNDEETGYLSSLLSLRNLNTGETSTSPISVPVATINNDGIMPATAMIAIEELDNKVLALQDGVTSYFVDFGSDTPSQEALTLLYQNASGSIDDPDNLAMLIDQTRNLYYQYYTSLETHWQGPYSYRYSVGSVGYLGLVSSSETEGQVYIEPVTGVMSLNGYSSIITAFNTLYGGTQRSTISVDQVPELPTSKITTGTFDSARLPTIPVTKGGTGLTTLSANKMLFSGATDNGVMREGASFGLLNTILASNGASTLPSFKSLTELGLALLAGGNSFTGVQHLTGTELNLLTLQNTDPTSYSRIKYIGTGKTFTAGVGNASSNIVALRDKFYIYDATDSKVLFTIDSNGNIENLSNINLPTGKTLKVNDVDVIANKELLTNKVTSISSSSTDTEYPSAKCMYDIIGNIETLLAEV